MSARVVASGPAQERTTPLTGETIGALPTSTPDDVVTAYERARAAQQEWAQRDVRERVEFLTRLHLSLIHI